MAEQKTAKRRAASGIGLAEYVTVREEMAILGRNRQTIYNLVNRGKLRKFKREVGGRGIGRTLFVRTEVEGLRDKVVRG
jgi:predicted DNA-binding transcriptional regulator AlpA